MTEGRETTAEHTATAFYEDKWNGPTGWRYFGWQCSCGTEEYVSREDGGLNECERRALAHSSPSARGTTATARD